MPPCTVGQISDRMTPTKIAAMPVTIGTNRLPAKKPR